MFYKLFRIMLKLSQIINRNYQQTPNPNFQGELPDRWHDKKQQAFDQQLKLKQAVPKLL